MISSLKEIQKTITERATHFHVLLNIMRKSVCLRVDISANIMSASGLDSTFGGLEAMITALCDEYPRFLGRHREIFVAVLLTGIYICALPTTTYVRTAI